MTTTFDKITDYISAEYDDADVCNHVTEIVAGFGESVINEFTIHAQRHGIADAAKELVEYCCEPVEQDD